jgi:ATP-dependent Lon protease
VFPEGNRADYEELTEDLKAGVTPHFVSSYDDVFGLALPPTSSQQQGGSGSGTGSEKPAAAVAPP